MNLPEDWELLPVLRLRRRPRRFDESHELADEQLAVMLEAARLARSAGNSQPWAFHPVRRHDAGWSDLIGCLANSSRTWAAQASLLVVNFMRVHVEGTDWQYSEFAAYDLGQAVAHMTIQAHSMGLACRQFRAFDKDPLDALLAVPDDWEITTMTAIGEAVVDVGQGSQLHDRAATIVWPRESQPRTFRR